MTIKILYKSILLLCISFSFFFFLDNMFVFSNDLQEYEEKLEDKKREKKESETYLEYLKSEIDRIQNSGYSLDYQIQLIDQEISAVESEMDRVLSDIEEKEEYIGEKEEELEKKQDQVNRMSDKLYRSSRVSFLDVLFSTTGDNNMVHSLILNRFVLSSQVTYMKLVAKEMDDLNEEKVSLEKEKDEFERDREEFVASKTYLAQQRSQVQAELNKQIAERNMVTRRIGGLEREISELQNFLLIMRSGGTVVNIESLGSGTGTGSLAYFRSNAPSGSFGVFSFGAYTHRNGMSQWGAWARNRNGQNYEQILKFYYPNTVIEKRDNLMGNIKVDGHGTMSFEDKYLMGIREINPAWNTQEDMEILKVQAITARSYAVARTSNGAHSICTTEACQVYNATSPHGGAWAQAVKETAGIVLTSGGSVVSTQYAAVHGGWVNGVGYDVRKSGGDWITESWDNISGVNWFYRNWHTKGYGTQTCSTQPNPWLSNAQMADIVNAYLYWSHSSVSSDSRVTAVDVATCWGQSGANPYSMNEMKEQVKRVGLKPVNSISNVVTSNSDGSTQSIVFVTDVGSIAVNNTAIFKEVYNMRAPAYFAIPQTSFIHINIERK